MRTEKEHQKTTLMGWTKEALVERVMALENNFNNLQERFDIQYLNCMDILEQMKVINENYKETLDSFKGGEAK